MEIAILIILLATLGVALACLVQLRADSRRLQAFEQSFNTFTEFADSRDRADSYPSLSYTDRETLARFKQWQALGGQR